MFSDVVKLYRAAGMPLISGGRFSFEGPADELLKSAVQRCQELGAGFGHFADGPDYDGDELEFTWALAVNESGRFYGSVDDLVVRCESIHRGQFPENFYIAALDFFSGEELREEVRELLVLKKLCELIRLLSELSVSGDLAAEAGRPSHLVFVKPASSGSPPVTVEITTRIQAKMLEGDCPDLGVLSDLLTESGKGKVRTEEYKAIFRLAVAGACADEPTAEARFGVLLDHWGGVLRRFRYDVECLVDRISFEGLRREIVEAELNFVGRMNTAVVDNATKFLGIPISLVAVAAVVGGSSIGNDLLVCAGAVIVALVVSGVARAVRLQMATTTTAFEAALAGMRARASAGGGVSESLDDLEGTFRQRRTFASRVIGTFNTLAWVPPLLGVAVVIWKFPPLWLTQLLADVGWA
ncbi:hypothetical protein M3581_05965 [Stenotrophomonas maltophilia]|nr:hypothetical protein [Stenotrophomonas maltophilia]